MRDHRQISPRSELNNKRAAPHHLEILQQPRYLDTELSCLPFRMIEMVKTYPYLNENAETNWKKENSNMKMSQDMTKITHRNRYHDKLYQYKVHDMSFIKQEGTSLPLVDCSRHSTSKEK